VGQTGVSMQLMPTYPKDFTLGVRLPYREVGKAWIAIFVWLLLLRGFPDSWTMRMALGTFEHVAVSATIITIVALCLVLMTKPFLIRLDKAASTLTCVRFGLPWRRTLDLQRTHSQIIRQESHSGIKHYLLLYADDKLVLSIGESIWWPYSMLEQLHRQLSTVSV
jgi:hypothetical protein